MNFLQAGVPALIVPFDAGSEQEQGLQADALARLSGFERMAAEVR